MASRASIRLIMVGLAVALLGTMLGSAMSGQLPVTPGQVIGVIGHSLGIGDGSGTDPIIEATLWNIRFPRIAAAALIGMALAVAGLMMQAIFANPLAEPAVVGVSSGAALGAATFLVFVAGSTSLAADVGTALSAFVAGLGATAVVYLISRRGGRTEVVTLVLTGIAINAFVGGALAFMLFAADSATREQLVFWQLGSLNGANWTETALILPPVLVGLAAGFTLASSYDLLALGERSAAHLGVRIERVRLISIVLVALLASAAVAFAGIIAFVGLVVPHLMRLLIGPAHRPLLLASALGGALLLSLADWAARTMIPMADLPIGMLTSLLGGPFFLWLLLRTRSRMGGFA